jgi:hypothetical protein
MKKIVLTWLVGLVAWAAFVPSSMAQTIDRSRVAISPFAQIVPGGPASGSFYTFLAFTHPSLSTAVSQIEITVSMEGPADNNFEPSGDRSETFTIGAGETHKLFIVPSNHHNLDPTAFPSSFGSRDHFIATSESFTPSGNIRVLTTNTTPTVASSGKFNNLNQISMWGVIFHEANGAGFAMEFIGDMHDSTVLPDGNSGNVVDLTTGRGIN